MDRGTSKRRRRYLCQSVDYGPRGIAMPSTLRNIQVLRTVLGRLNAERRAERRPAGDSALVRPTKIEAGTFEGVFALRSKAGKGKHESLSPAKSVWGNPPSFGTFVMTAGPFRVWGTRSFATSRKRRARSDAEQRVST